MDNLFIDGNGRPEYIGGQCHGDPQACAYRPRAGPGAQEARR
ncbi:MAG TPA: hypothetical protein VHF46_03445 [Rubrobacteraceae bacterium]|nr:hypothetical protein [Rubrobacteraceae bacterium]